MNLKNHGILSVDDAIRAFHVFLDPRGGHYNNFHPECLRWLSLYDDMMIKPAREGSMAVYIAHASGHLPSGLRREIWRRQKDMKWDEKADAVRLWWD